MKKAPTILLFAFLFLLSYAKQVPLDTAKIVAKNFLVVNTNSYPNLEVSSIELVYTASSKANSNLGAIEPNNYFYIFNTVSPLGFIIVSADDNVIPVLGYSDENNFDPNNIPPNCAKWLEGYKNEIRYVIENNVSETQEIRNDWVNLKSNNPVSSGSRSGSVAPLVQTHWNQSPHYNDLCPYNNTASERTVTGCVATAMAQIMKYWNYPPHGYGSHNYSCPGYGNQAANFGATTYQWNQMPYVVSSTNNAVATLMYHCGVSVDMNYGITSNGGGGSSAQTLDVANALKTYFGYSSTTQGLYQSNYSPAQWIQLLKSELDAARPVQYAGTGSGGGHSFVCDGYDQNDWFHFNWGWGPTGPDGYFPVNALNPGSLGTGGGTGGYNSNQRAIIGIQPPTATTSYDLRLYSAISVTANPFQSGGAFTVNADIGNYGSSNFTGSFSAALFNDQGVFVQFIQTLSGQTLQAGFHNTFTFSTNPLSLIPGTYTLVVYYNTGGSNYVIVNQGSFVNPGSITVTGPPNDIQMHSNTTVSPSPVVLGQASTISADIANYGATDFTGWISAELYDMQGNWVVTVDELQGTINSNTYATTTFSTAGLNVSPGTYYVAFFNTPDYSNWHLIYNGSYPNPIAITVVDPPLSPDIYEVNNSIAQAYTLPITFSGNTATKNTTGSNCHVGNDYDYYKINLASGYSYTFNARLHDAYNSGNGQTYSLDALVSYSLDGVNLSDAFDDVISPSFTANGGSSVYFFVAPYFQGETGTYLLDLSVTRTPCTLSPSVTPSGPLTICQNQTLTLTAPAGTGYTYQWKRNGTIITTNANSQTYNVTQSGSYSVLVTSGGCSAISNTVVVTVNPTSSPSVSISSNPAGIVCPGTNITFTATSSGGGTAPAYQWKVNGNNVGSNSPIFNSSTLTNGDIITVVLTSNASCATQSTATSSPFTVLIWGPAVANAGNDTTIAQGGSAVLTATGGINYQWSNGGTAQSTTVFPASDSTYTVTVTNANGCTATDNVTVFVQSSGCNGVYQLSATTALVPATGGTATVNLTTGANCTWSVNAGACSSFTTVNTPNGSGSGTVSFTVQPNPLPSQRTCFTTIAGQLFQIIQQASPTGLNETSLIHNISLYPNPNRGQFTLNIESAQQQNLTASIFNALGQLVHTQQVQTNTPTNITLTNTTNGIYYLQLQLGQTNHYLKIAIE